MVSLLVVVDNSYSQEIGGATTRRTNLTVKVDGADEPVYYVGGEVKPPKLISMRKLQSGDQKAGTVAVSMIVTSKGDITNIKIIDGFNATLDAQAIKTASN
jgi:hypothetical protein